MSQTPPRAKSREPRADIDMNASATPLVSTIGERCRVCYQCVRECPAKAIRIADRRRRCSPSAASAAATAFKVCTQSAKRVVSAVEDVEALLAGSGPRRRHHRAELPGRVHRPRLPGGRRHAARARVRFGSRSGVRRRAGGARVPPPGRARQRTRLDRHNVPGGRRLRRAVLSGPHAGPGADRLADDRHGAPAAPSARGGSQGRLRRPLHREEARDGRTPGRGRRGADVRRSAPDGHCARHRPAIGRGLRVRPAATAAAAACSRSAAACCRWRASRRTWSPGR